MDKKYFFFENRYDFPYYSEKNKDSTRNLIILLITPLLFAFLIMGPIQFFKGQEQVILFLTTFFMLLFLTRGNLGVFFKKISFDDLRLVIVSYILYAVYYLLIVSFLQLINFKTVNASTSFFTDLNLLYYLTFILQVFAEEIFKIFLFLLLLGIIYSRIGNRKKSIIIAVFLTLIIFGLLHYNSYPSIVQIILIQGFGGIFELYPYIKTKNMLIPIMVHLLINFSSWFMLLFGLV